MSSEDRTNVIVEGKIRSSPLYVQLMQIFEECIRSKEWRVGGSIPSEAELARKYHVSLGTARKALGELERAGVIERKQGRGSFVSAPAAKVVERLHSIVLKDKLGTNAYAAGFLELVADEHDPPTAIECEVFGFEKDVTIRRISAKLEVKDSVIVVEQASFVTGSFDCSSSTNLSTGLLERLLSTQAIPIFAYDETITIVEPPSLVSNVFALEPGQRILRSRAVLKSASKDYAIYDRYIDSQSAEFRHCGPNKG